jgi:hypothetical protein
VILTLVQLVGAVSLAVPCTGPGLEAGLHLDGILLRNNRLAGGGGTRGSTQRDSRTVAVHDMTTLLAAGNCVLWACASHPDAPALLHSLGWLSHAMQCIAVSSMYWGDLCP